MVSLLKEAMVWAEAHFSDADLGDVRRTRRLVEVMGRMAEAPESSLPARMGTVAGAKAAYRLFDTGAVTHAAVIHPHRRLCLAEAARHPVVLIIHDDTLLDFSGHRALSGTGPIGNGHGTGFMAHSGLAVLPSGEILGLAHQAIWARPSPNTPAQGTPAAPSASRVWSDTVTAVGPAPDGTRFVSVGDRGSDVFDHLATARALGWEVVVRAYQDRRMIDGQRSLTALRQAKAQAATTVATRDGDVAVCLAWRPLEILPPGGSAGLPLRVTGIRVWGHGLEWILLTTGPVAEAQDALQRTGWYALRWTVEDFHKAWKTGCRVEHRRLAAADRLTPLLGALAVLAVRLLVLRDEARRAGDAPSDAPASALQILSRKLKRPVDSFRTRRGFLHGVAQLGGFLARTSDGDPGWQTIWKGWMRLMAMTEGFEMAVALPQEKCG